MRRFHNILYVSHGTGEETEALKQAFSLACTNRAALNILIIHPDLPREMEHQKENYQKFLVEQLKNNLRTVQAGLAVKDEEVPNVRIGVESGDAPAIRVIRHVLREGYDLVVKDAEHAAEQAEGFRAIDMELLSKCPVPVWLCRPISRPRSGINIAVAIDPEKPEPKEADLAIALLRTARELADTCSGTLYVISCWEFEFEGYLRHNAWTNMPDGEVLRVVNATKQTHRAALDRCIEHSGIGGDIQLHHPRGRPEEVIPDLLKRYGVDVLVMGTVARTGIPGFIFGNTAEDILHKVSCTLLALKPQGFVSPVKAY